MIGERHIKQYREEGWFTVEKLFTPEQVEDIFRESHRQAPARHSISLLLLPLPLVGGTTRL